MARPTSVAVTGGSGNPDLRPWRANAVDLTFEKYFGTKGFLGVQFFYKDLKSYIYNQDVVIPTSSLALASPRVTATQEGLATFAEQITGSIDIERLKRISLRIVAIHMAMHGADFIEVFRYFLDAGQTEADSFASTQRVFRGVPTTGGAAFTKDTVYLRGLVSVHTFFRHMLAEDRLQVCRWLFAGKMSLHDAIASGGEHPHDLMRVQRLLAFSGSGSTDKEIPIKHAAGAAYRSVHRPGTGWALGGALV